MRDLDDLLAADLAARERRLGAAAPAGVLQNLDRRVRRNRVRRHAIQGVASFAALAVIGSVSVWGLSRPAPAPAVTPEPTATSAAPTPTPTPTPTPSATVMPTPTPTAGETEAAQALPQATPELLASATTGWVLASQTVGGATPSQELLLVSPTGAKYHLVDLTLDEYVEVQRWRAGARTADAVQTWAYGVRPQWVRVDLLTGAITKAVIPASSNPQWEHDVGWSSDGRRVIVAWDGTIDRHYDPTPVYLRAFDGTQTHVQDVTWYDQTGYGLDPMLDPTGTQLLFWSPRVPATFSGPVPTGSPTLDQFAQVLDLRTGALSRQVIDLPDACTMVDWFADSTVLAACGPDVRWNYRSQMPSADGWPDGENLVGYRLDPLHQSAPERLYDLPGLPPLGVGTTTPRGVWLYVQGAVGAGPALPSFWPAQPGAPRALTLPSSGAWAYADVLSSVGETVYVTLSSTSNTGPGTYTVALASMVADGGLTVLFSGLSPEDEVPTFFVVGS